MCTPLSRNIFDVILCTHVHIYGVESQKYASESTLVGLEK